MLTFHTQFTDLLKSCSFLQSNTVVSSVTRLRVCLHQRNSKADNSTLNHSQIRMHVFLFTSNTDVLFCKVLLRVRWRGLVQYGTLNIKLQPACLPQALLSRLNEHLYINTAKSEVRALPSPRDTLLLQSNLFLPSERRMHVNIFFVQHDRHTYSC